MYLVRMENQLIIDLKNAEETLVSSKLTPTKARRIAIVTIQATN